MSEKKINYIARDFNAIKDELIKFSKTYYPELSDSFNDASVGAWIIDLVSAVGDDLSYHTDRMYQENFIDSANLRSSVLNNARLNGVKVPKPKASVCEIEISCIIPGLNVKNMSNPAWKYAPYIVKGGLVTDGKTYFEIMENVDFSQQFNENGISNRRYVPLYGPNGVIQSYQVYKTVLATSGRSIIYKKVITENDVKPFMEIILPEQNIMEVESVIFKEGTDFSANPDTYEYFIDEESFRVSPGTPFTYRYFEVDSLADQYRFGTVSKIADKVINDKYQPEVYVDYGEMGATTRYYKGVWKGLRNKFITETTDNGYTKLIFGSGSTPEEVPTNTSMTAQNIVSNIVNNNMLGILPKAGWTMYCMYRIGGGIETNVAQGAINTISNFKTHFTDISVENGNDPYKKKVLNTLKVTNITTAVGGKDELSTEELKYYVKYNVGAQNRCVTLKDYKTRLMMMPAKYGAPFRCSVIEDNNKIMMGFLGLKADGKLDSTLPETLVENMIEYMGHFKNMTDYIEMKSGKIYNLGFEVDIFVDKDYTTAEVINRVINTITNYFDVNKRDMGEDIFISDLQKEINVLDGVVALIDLRIFNIWGNQYSKDKCTLPEGIDYSNGCNGIASTFNAPHSSGSYQIGLDKTDGVLYNDFDSMFEILNPLTDIVIRAKVR